MNARFWSSLLLPIVLLGVAIGVFLVSEPLSLLGVSPPPIEELSVERTVLDEKGIGLRVRAAGSDPMHIAQVQVDGAYWRFTQEPAGALARGESAWIRLPYHWVKGELHEITFVTNTGATFDHTIEVAEATPEMSAEQFIGYGLLGLYVGVLPVALGMLFRPALQRAGSRGLEFALALTLGLLVFLLVDTIDEGLELGEQAASLFQGTALVWLAALVTFGVLMAVGRRHREPPRGLALARYIALGIGLHNLGEGLAIGGSFAAGAAALGTFLVIGFTLHNLTEGIGIAAPLTRERVRWVAWVGLVALAGLPAVLGTWIGAYAYAPHWSALMLGMGAGAILQVIVEVGDYLRCTIAREGVLVSITSVTGFTLGIVVMYATAYFVQV